MGSVRERFTVVRNDVGKYRAFPAVGHIPERMDSFQVAVLFLNRFLVESLGKLQCALHDDITCF